MTLNYSGNLAITGSFSASDGETANFSGTFGVTISATLDGSGNGSATENVSGTVTVHYYYHGGSNVAQLPLSFSEPNLPFSLGGFSGSETIPTTLFGAPVGVTLTGSTSSDQHTITENITLSTSGFYHNYSFSLTMHATGTLIAPYTPTITGTAANQAAIDTTGITAFHNVTISDQNPGAVTVTVTMSSAANGSFSNLAGGSYNSNTGTYTVSGTQSSVTAALEGLVFTPTQHQVPSGQTVTTTFSIQVSDTSGGSASSNATSVITTDVGPAISGTQNNQNTLDVNPVTLFHNVTITDTYTGTGETVTVTMSAAANGTFTNLAGGSYNAGTGVYTVSGTAAQVTSALDGLVFNPTRGQAAPGQLITTGFGIQVTDTQGISASNGTSSVVTTETGLGIGGGVATQPTPDYAPISPFSSVVISDPVPTRIETVTVTNFATYGTLTNFGSGSYDSGTGVYTVSGTAAQVTAAIEGLVFNPIHQNQAYLGDVLNSGISIHATNGAGQTADYSTTIRITVTGPSISGLTSDVQTTLDTLGIKPFQNAVITDTNPNAVDTVQVGVSNPGYNLNGTYTNLGGGAYNAMTELYTVSGTAAQVTAALQGLTFAPTYHQAAGGQSVNTGFIVIDSNNAGAVSDPQDINITAIQTGPTLILSPAFQGGSGHDLARDSAGNLLGTTRVGGAGGFGSVYEFPNGATTPTTVFSATYSGELNNDLILDAAGNIIGSTTYGSASDPGMVFEIAKTAGGYANSLTPLVSFSTAQHVSVQPGLVADAAGNLFGATAPGTSTPGTVFEIAKTGGSYAATATTLVTFGGATAGNPNGNLFIDANGDLFGTTENGGAGGDGTLFEIAKTGGTYASTATVLYTFDGSAGETPVGNLLMDADGNLYGTTIAGTSGVGLGDPNFMLGTLYELAKTPGGYAATPDVLVDFGLLPENNALNWGGPYTLAMDAAGNIFGEATGGTYGGGKLFELTKGAGGYSAPAIVYNFGNFFYPSGLTIDGAGNVYGTAGDNTGGLNVFELRHSGFQGNQPQPAPSDFNADRKSDLIWQNTDGTTVEWFLNGGTLSSSGVAGVNPGPSWHVKGTGDFDGDGKNDLVLQNDNGSVSVWLMNGTTLVNGGSPGNPGTAWHVIGTGDFDGDGKSDILLQNDDGQLSIWLMNGTTMVGGGSPGNPGAAWHAVATGDFNDDGKSDIVLQNDSGQISIWFMNGTALASSAVSNINPGPGWQVKGAGDFNGDGYSDLVLQNYSGQAEIWLMAGASAPVIAKLPNLGASWHVMGTGDFNGDGKSDLAWQSDSGQGAIWLMDGTTVTGTYAAGPSVGTAWHIANDGDGPVQVHYPVRSDFNGDGTSDLLLQSDSGQITGWLMNGSILTSSGSPANPGPAWHVKATGDFDGDGKADILLQNDNGQASIWFMNGTTLTSGVAAGPNPGAAWKVVGAGDFDGDGKSDILLQNDDGQMSIWFMNGGTLTSGVAAGPNPGSSWHAIATGDFNGDGKSDILLQNDNGQVSVWLMDGGTLVSGGAPGNPGTSWHVRGAADMDGDGKSDILLQNDSGQASIWFMNGTTLTSGVAAGPNPGTSWSLTGAADLDGDGKSELIWQNSASGQVSTWFMNGSNLLSGATIGSASGSQWHIVAANGG